MPSASLWNKHTIPHLCPKFVVISHSTSFCSFVSKPISSTYILSLLAIPSSKYPRYYLCSMYHETECAIVAAFCTLFLLLYDNNSNTGPLSVSSMFFNQFSHYSETAFSALHCKICIRVIIVYIYLLFSFDFWFSVALD